MKTKSKRFLNLATLCLALLGTTLLMARPVKASETYGEDVELRDSGEISTQDSDIRERYLKNVGMSEEDLKKDSHKYDRGRLDGYVQGYKDGQKSTLRTPENSSPYDGPEEGDYKTGYNDGYGSGYGDGWEEEHPIQSFLSYVWGMITEFFFPSSSSS
ncbi:hypothetical protein [Streptococcus pyogenes]|uniref:hypothetical protein n=1 Tax=Streptococcus pyogenes TaxID=1314 RepID=UPI0010A0F688|nr:hypothetical protein [Streptococcus pyogenes]VHA85014.1 Uncharacterised protein [Streptococcus pyogenes]VHB81447.1 Uncharacterised protein [Streptococcus pyogenes]VHD29671.1 Uncharacterised protein [Streptococcus pyogenes]